MAHFSSLRKRSRTRLLGSLFAAAAIATTVSYKLYESRSSLAAPSHSHIPATPLFGKPDKIPEPCLTEQCEKMAAQIDRDAAIWANVANKLKWDVPQHFDTRAIARQGAALESNTGSATHTAGSSYDGIYQFSLTAQGSLFLTQMKTILPLMEQAEPHVAALQKARKYLRAAAQQSLADAQRTAANLKAAIAKCEREVALQKRHHTVSEKTHRTGPALHHKSMPHEQHPVEKHKHPPVLVPEVHKAVVHSKTKPTKPDQPTTQHTHATAAAHAAKTTPLPSNKSAVTAARLATLRANLEQVQNTIHNKQEYLRSNYMEDIVKTAFPDPQFQTFLYLTSSMLIDRALSKNSDYQALTPQNKTAILYLYHNSPLMALTITHNMDSMSNMRKLTNTPGGRDHIYICDNNSGLYEKECRANPLGVLSRYGMIAKQLVVTNYAKARATRPTEQPRVQKTAMTATTANAH